MWARPGCPWTDVTPMRQLFAAEAYLDIAAGWGCLPTTLPTLGKQVLPWELGHMCLHGYDNSSVVMVGIIFYTQGPKDKRCIKSTNMGGVLLALWGLQRPFPYSQVTCNLEGKAIAKHLYTDKIKLFLNRSAGMMFWGQRRYSQRKN